MNADCSNRKRDPCLLDSSIGLCSQVQLNLRPGGPVIFLPFIMAFTSSSIVSSRIWLTPVFYYFCGCSVFFCCTVFCSVFSSHFLACFCVFLFCFHGPIQVIDVFEFSFQSSSGLSVSWLFSLCCCCCSSQSLSLSSLSEVTKRKLLNIPVFFEKFAELNPHASFLAGTGDTSWGPCKTRLRVYADDHMLLDIMESWGSWGHDYGSGLLPGSWLQDEPKITQNIINKFIKMK
jgi:hypothetical protein